MLCAAGNVIFHYWMKHGKVYIYGKHALTEALVNVPHAVKKVYLSPKVDDQKLRDLIRRAGVPMAALEPKMERTVEGHGTHQGVIAHVSTDDLVMPLKDFLKGLTITDDTALVLMGEVQDPHNVGAIIRSAAAFGVSGVLMPEHNQAPVTGAVVKVSAGMAFRIPLVQIGNINQAVRDLKDAGFSVYGLAGEAGAQNMTEMQFDTPSVFIVGNEGSGIRQKTREYCDALVAIPMHPKCESLNAAVSASVALYAWSSKHPKALKGK